MKVLFSVCAFVQYVLSMETLSDCKKLCKCEFESRDTIVTCRGEHVHDVPQNLPRNTTELYLSGTSIKVVTEHAFENFPLVSTIFFRDDLKSPCLLETLVPKCFDDMNFLKVIGIIRCHNLHTIESGVFGQFRVLDTIEIRNSGLTSVPNLDVFRTMNQNLDQFMYDIDFSNNQIQEINEHAFLSVKTHLLKLNNNKIQRIHNAAFYWSQIINLQLQENPLLTELDEGAFNKVVRLEKLDLSYTAINKLPKKGLANILELRLKGTKTLRQFPSVLYFNKITKAEMHYPHHCCLFKNPEKQDPSEWRAYIEFQRRVQLECSVSTIASTASTTGSGIDGEGISTSAYTFEKRIKRHGYIFNDTNDIFGFGRAADPSIFNQSSNLQHQIDGKLDFSFGFNDKVSVPPNSSNTLTAFCGQVVKDYRQVICTPEPDAFNPCEDLMGYEWLRIFVWIILLAALFGNTVVLIVLIKSRSKMSVTKFLMCNLAFADLTMGIYLLLLASIDAHTLGEYFNYAVIWQNEGGCQAAGFLTVFSCELSIFTLTIITLERWYAISHAIQLTKRLRIRQAMVFMAFGWLYALFMAHLPLIGISAYGHVSICLPMKVDDAADVVYVVSLLVINGFAFICICGCYINMYCKVRGSHNNVRNNDATIAKRMAMLVFTNFVCWAPIAFFGLTASAGVPLIDITNSKILLVFFYPLNSFANPYLYVIITKQFRKDVYLLLGKYGICTEKANRYRVTFTSSHSRNSLALHNNIHNANRNGVKGINSKASTSHSGFSRSPSNSESMCSTSTFLHTNSKQPSIRIRLPETKKIVDKILKETPEAPSTERRLRSPPPYVRSTSEYVVFFPPPMKETYPKYKYQSGRPFSVETSLNGAISESSATYQSDENPWTFQTEVQNSDQQISTINAIDEETLEDFESMKISDVKNLEDLNQIQETYRHVKKCFYTSSDDECDDDNVQQTLLKHCTLRESPGSTIDRKFPSDPLLSDLNKKNCHTGDVVICQCQSSPNIDKIDGR